MNLTFAEVLKAMEVAGHFQSYARERYFEYVSASGKGLRNPDTVEAYLLSGERVCIDVSEHYYDGSYHVSTDYHSITIPFDKLQEEGYGTKLGLDDV